MRITTTLAASIFFAAGVLSSGEAQVASDGEQQVANSIVYDFEFDDDRNFDLWPDYWSKREGTGYPHYQDIGIIGPDEELGNADQCLRIELDGGAAEVSTPEIEIDARFSYYLEFEGRTFETDRDEANEAWVSIEFLDDRGNMLRRYESEKLQRVDEFTHYRVGPINQPESGRTYAKILLHVQPTRSSDLFGGACFDNIRLIPFPKLEIETNQPYNIYTPDRLPEITLRISGVQEANARLTFQLLDAFKQPLSPIEEQPLVMVQEDKELNETSSLDDQVGDDVSTGDLNYRSLLDELQDVHRRQDLKRLITLHWKPPVSSHGFYCVQVRLLVGDEVRLERLLTLAIIDAEEQVADSHFGWTLPRQSVATSLPQLTELVKRSGVRWIKYPVWYGKSDVSSAEWIAGFAERLSEADITLVGIIDHPPEEHMDVFNQDEEGIASLLREPELWQPTINHVLARLSLKVHWWQLGDDHDLSFVGYPNLYGRVTEIRDTLSRFAKDMSLGLNWQWLHHFPASEDYPWDFRHYLASPELTDAELVEYLALEKDSSRVWTSLQPLAANQYPLETRVRDLISRMTRIKIAGATGFVIEPFSDTHGLMRSDGTPGELFVPWRTTSFQLAGLEYIGQIRLPSGSQNYIFSDGETATMLVWNDKPVTEALFLGKEVVVTDIWGDKQEVPAENQVHHIQVDSWPRFVSGLDPNVAQFRMEFDFDRTILASIFGQRQYCGLKFHNVYPRGASGRILLHSEELWSKPIEVPFKVASGEQFEREFPIVLKSFASTGIHPVRVDVTLDADKRYDFSVFREIQVGFGKVALEHQVEPLTNGDLRILGTLVNNSYDTVNFDCYLLVPGRRKQRRQVMRLGHGRETVEFYLEVDPNDPVEEVWIRAEEIRGNRILNHHFKIDTGKSSTAEVEP